MDKTKQERVMANISNKESSGRSMIEMLGVLAIVGVLSIGGISGYTKAMTKYKISRTLDQIILTVTAIHGGYGLERSYAGLNNSRAIQYNLVDSDLTHGTSILTNHYGGNVDISVVDSDPTLFSMTYYNIPTDSCGLIASYNWGDSASLGLVSIQIGEGNSHDWEQQDDAHKLPITVSRAITECKEQAGTSGATSITWIYQ